ncbi:hypothetical protein ACLB2K_047435 [Fragaria x ananassa]
MFLKLLEMKMKIDWDNYLRERATLEEVIITVCSLEVEGQLDDRMNSPEERVEKAFDSLSSFGQTNYQRQKQGIIIEYKDFGDTTFQCNHCNAYY